MAAESEDILYSSLSTLYDYAPVTHSSAGDEFIYSAPFAPLTVALRTPDTAAKNWDLHASSIWVASIFIADHLPELLALLPLHSRVLELGAGAGLPSILLSKAASHAQIVCSDYPDDAIIAALEDSVTRNFASGVHVVPYAWGSDPALLLVHAPGGFDVVLAADTLWNSDTHELLLQSLERTLARREDARVHCVAGLHTGRYTIAAFIKRLSKHGLVVHDASEREVSGEGRRDWDVTRAELEDERERRRWVVWIAIGWDSDGVDACRAAVGDC
ncbi:hypothetical protein PENSPDRAFT_649042 [Peniophora sp. CONT]|nr:hypothetical protein PENSPDRAFT_649042 [Peniophora sp. CONT]